MTERSQNLLFLIFSPCSDIFQIFFLLADLHNFASYSLTFQRLSNFLHICEEGDFSTQVLAKLILWCKQLFIQITLYLSSNFSSFCKNSCISPTDILFILTCFCLFKIKCRQFAVFVIYIYFKQIVSEVIWTETFCCQVGHFLAVKKGNLWKPQCKAHVHIFKISC